MKLHQLRDVMAVAERGSLRAAARQLGIAQPALTRSIRTLEEELGVLLFERRSRGVVPTSAGQLFIRRAGAIVREIRRAREEIEQAQGGLRGTVVACLSSMLHVALGRALTPFRARFPDVRLHIWESRYPAIETALMDGSVDFYIGPIPAGPVATGLASEMLSPNARIVVGREGHPLSSARSLCELVAADWITTSVTRKAEEELGTIFAQYRLPAPRIVMQAQSALSAVVAIAHSDALAMVPKQWLELEATRHGLVHIAIKEAFSAPAIVFVRREWLPLTPAAEFLSESLRRAIATSAKRPAKGV